MLNTLKSEWTKLHTTRSFWWTTFIFLFFVWGWAILNARLTQPAETPEDVELGMGIITPDGAVTFLFSLGLPVLMIQAIMIVTTEYRYGIPATNFRVAPRRWHVAVVKLVLGALLAALLTVLGLALVVALRLRATPFSDIATRLPEELRAQRDAAIAMEKRA